MKKSLTVFAVAVGLTVLSIFLGVIRSVLFSLSQYNLGMAAVSSLLFSLVDICVVFGLFFFLGKRTKIKVSKSITLALLVAVLIGTLIFVLPIGSYSLPFGVTFLEEYFYILTDSVIGSFLQVFFPALAALLFAELREKNSNNGLTA